MFPMPAGFRGWSETARDIVVLSVVALLARAIAALLVPYAPYTDPAYYTLVAERLADGHGFTVPVLWSFLEVGGQLPENGSLPVPSNGHWMPLTSIVSAAFMSVLGSSWRAGQVPMVLLSAALVPFTYHVARHFWGTRWVAIISALLAVFAGPLLIMYPTIDNFAVFGVAGGTSIYASMRATDSPTASRWLVVAGVAAGIATLARIDGVLLVFAPATAWLVRRGWSPWGAGGRHGPAPSVLAGLATVISFAVPIIPWLVRNIATFGRPLPSTGGHTLWITEYNEQFSIGHEVSPATYFDWGLPNIIASKFVAWFELLGRTGVLLGGTFFIFLLAGLWMTRRRADLAPFLVYFIVMFGVMGAVFTFHAPKGAFYHSSPAWLPFALPLAVAAVPRACAAAGRLWPFLRRPQTHRFVAVVGVVGAMVLSVIGSTILLQQWQGSRHREELAGEFLMANARTNDVVMYSDPASLYFVSGNPGVAAPFDPYPVIEDVIRRYEVRWVVIALAEGTDRDPLGLWDGADAVDLYGNPATFLPERPSFEADGVRIYAVNGDAQAGPSTIGPP